MYASNYPLDPSDYIVELRVKHCYYIFDTNLSCFLFLFYFHTCIIVFLRLSRVEVAIGLARLASQLETLPPSTRRGVATGHSSKFWRKEKETTTHCDWLEMVGAD